MAQRQIKLTKGPYKDYATSWDRITGIDFGGFGKKIAVTPNIQRTAAFWQGKNVTVEFNQNGSPDQYIIPPGRMNRFIEAGTLTAGDDPADPNRAVTNWNADNINRWTDWISRYCQALITTDSVDEDNTGVGSISSIYNPELFYQAMYAAGSKFKVLGYEYYKTYAGDCYITRPDDPYFANSENYRGSLTNNQTALTNLRPGGLHNHRNTPAWNAPTSDHPSLFDVTHVLLNMYYASASAYGTAKARLAEFTCNLIISRNGLAALGNTTAKILSFFWLNNTEFGYYQVRAYRNPPAGGTITTDNFPNYSFKWQLAMVILAHILGDRIYGWDNGQAFGQDPNKVPFDYGTPGNSYIHYEGGSATRADISRGDYTSSQAEHAYPLKPLGFDDALPEGGRMFQLMAGWTGTAVFAPAPHRLDGTSTYSGTGKDAILDSFQQKTVYALLSQSGSHRSLFMYSFADGYQTVNVDVNGLVNTYTLAPGTPYCYLITIPATGS